MAEIGKASKEEIVALKAKYSEVYEIKSVRDDDVHYTYVKKPDLNIISAAAKYAESDPVQSGMIMFNSTRIAGSDAVVNDSEMVLGVIQYIGKLFKVIEAEGKKL
ncbi:MAG: hypothetical protein COZ76_05385 [Flavobacteriales bacterium CG_4_8_14_3_um_filter_35_10]|nr:MAG: hypothetical protein COZ76_05385 [Flavobacteriales bacterium CG_4_8_14_3_um_filter_35_10]